MDTDKKLGTVSRRTYFFIHLERFFYPEDYNYDEKS